MFALKCLPSNVCPQLTVNDWQFIPGARVHTRPVAVFKELPGWNEYSRSHVDSHVKELATGGEPVRAGEFIRNRALDVLDTSYACVLWLFGLLGSYLGLTRESNADPGSDEDRCVLLLALECLPCSLNCSPCGLN